MTIMTWLFSYMQPHKQNISLSELNSHEYHSAILLIIIYSLSKLEKWDHNHYNYDAWKNGTFSSEGKIYTAVSRGGGGYL